MGSISTKKLQENNLFFYSVDNIVKPYLKYACCLCLSIGAPSISYRFRTCIRTNSLRSSCHFSPKHCTPSALNESYRRQTTPRAVFSRRGGCVARFSNCNANRWLLVYRCLLLEENTILTPTVGSDDFSKRMPSANFKHKENNLYLSAFRLLPSSSISRLWHSCMVLLVLHIHPSPPHPN